MNELQSKNTNTDSSTDMQSSCENNFTAKPDDLLEIEKKIQYNINKINEVSHKLEILFIQQKQYKDKVRIKETFNELDLCLKKQDICKDNFFKQKVLLNEQKILRTKFRVLREDIHSINLKISETSKLKKKLDEYEKQINTVSLSINQIQSTKKNYLDQISLLKNLRIKHKNDIDALKENAIKSLVSSDTSLLFGQYNDLSEELNIELNDIYNTKIEELLNQLELQNIKDKKANEYKYKLKKNKTELLDALEPLGENNKILQEKKKSLLEIEKIGQANNEKLSKISHENYDQVLHKNLIEQYKTIKIEYQLVLELEHNIKNIPSYKEELTFLQDQDVIYTEQKIGIIHKLPQK